MGPLTRQQVIWCYTTLLHREPESDATVDHYVANFQDLASMVRFVVTTDEFKLRTVDPIKLSDFKYTDAADVQGPTLDVLRPLEPVKVADHAKIRIGNAGDGGYVMVDDLEGIAIAYSFGISDDVTWDLAMAERGVEIFQYDHTIDALPEQHPRFHWFRQGIARESAGDMRSLPDIMAEHGHLGRDDLLLKCDIEGHEWEMLAHAGTEHLKCFKQIVLEMHGFQNLDLPDFQRLATAAVRNLAKTHAVVHVHANNNSGYSIVGAVPVPSALELTLVRRDAYALEANDETFPTKLDAACFPGRADFALGMFRF